MELLPWYYGDTKVSFQFKMILCIFALSFAFFFYQLHDLKVNARAISKLPFKKIPKGQKCVYFNLHPSSKSQSCPLSNLSATSNRKDQWQLWDGMTIFEI